MITFVTVWTLVILVGALVYLALELWDALELSDFFAGGKDA